MNTDRPTVLADLVRGRSSLSPERREDALTARVLGVLAWMPAPLALGPWLAGAVTETGARPGWGADALDISVQLWPWWEEADVGLPGAEPDVELIIETPTSRELLVLECKLDASLSGADQLRRQHAHGVAVAYQRGLAFRGVVYVTADLGCPAAELAASRALIGQDARLAWLSWRDLPPVLDRAARALGGRDPLLAAMAMDLRLVLARLGLDRFRGFSPVVSIPEPSFSRKTT